MGDHTLSQNEDQTGLDIIKPASFNQSSFERGGTSSNHLQSEKLHLQALELNALLQIKEENKNRKRSANKLNYHHIQDVQAEESDDLARNVELAKHELSVQSKKHQHHNQSASFTQTSRDLKALQYNKQLQNNAEDDSADYNSQQLIERPADNIRATAKSERLKQEKGEDSKQSFVISQMSGFQCSEDAVALRQSKNSQNSFYLQIGAG